MNKMSETFAKVVFKGKDYKKLSSVEPKLYAQRFAAFMSEVVIIDVSSDAR